MSPTFFILQFRANRVIMSDRFGAISITPPTGDTPLPPQRKTPQRPGSRPQSSRKRSRPEQEKNRSILLLVLIPVALLLAYGGGGFLFGAPLLVQRFSSLLEESVGMSMQAQEARFNPFTLRLQLTNTTITAAASKEEQPLINIAHLAINLNLLTLLRGGIASDDLDIHGLNANIIRHQDRSYNLPAPTHANTPGEGQESLALARLPLLFSLNNIKIRDSKVLFDDRVNGRQHRIEQIQLDLPTLSNFSFASSANITPHFSALINGSPLELTGEAALPGGGGEQAGATNLSCNIQNLDLSLYFSYLPDTLPFKLEKGRAQGQIQIAFLPQEKKEGQLRLDLRLTVTDTNLTAARHLALHAPSMEIKGNLRPFEKELHITSLLMHKPIFTANRETVHTDLATLLAREKDPNPPGRTARQRLKIDNLGVEEGSLTFAQSQQEQKGGQTPTWNAVKLTIQGFDSAPDQTSSQGSFNLSATRKAGNEGNNPTSLHWEGAFNARSLPEGKLQIKSLPAATLLAFLDPTLEATGSADLYGQLAYDPGAAKGATITLVDGRCELHDLKLLAGSKPWLHAATVQLTGLDLQGNELDLGSVKIQQGNLILNQDKFPSLLAADKPGAKALSLKELEATGGITLQPASDKAPALQLTEIRLKAGKLTAGSGDRNNFDLSARLGEKGVFQTRGIVSFFPFRSALTVNLNAISLPDIAPWLPDAPLFKASSGVLSGSGSYRFPEPTFTGNLEIDTPVFRTDSQSPGLHAAKAGIQDISIKTHPLRMGIGELSLHQPAFTWRQEPDGPGPAEQIQGFLQGLMGQPETGKTTPVAPPILNTITFQQGSLAWTDNRLSPPWSPPITDLEGRITGLHAKGNGDTRFDLSGNIAATPFSLSGTADFLSSPVTCTSKLELHGLPLQALAPQITPQFALDPASGTIDLLLDRNQENGQEKGEAQILLSGLRPQGADADTALPLALLNDENNRIALPLALNDPRQSLVKQAAASFKTLLVKGAVAPLLLAGSEFSDLQDRHTLPFPPGSAELEDGSAQEVLRRFADLLTARPGVGLLLTGMADPKADREAIRAELEEKELSRVTQLNEQRMQEWQRLQAQKKQLPPPTPPPGKIVEQNIPAKELAPPVPLAPKPVTVADTALHDLAQERALHVYDFLTSLPGITSGRITIQDKTLLAPPGAAGTQVMIGLQALNPAKPQ